MYRKFNFFTTAGGQGCTTAAIAFALRLAHSNLRVGLCGDPHLPAHLGIPTPMDDTHQVTDSLTWMTTEYAKEYGDQHDVIIEDFGRDPISDGDSGCRIFVTKQCYVSVHAYVREGHEANGCIILEEPGRALTQLDIERATDLKCLKTITWDPGVFRAVDAGLLTSRPPSTLRDDWHELAKLVDVAHIL